MATAVCEHTLVTQAQAYVEKLHMQYIEGHIRKQEFDRLIEENNIEKRDIKGYHGREILELLQNADDAYGKSILEGHRPDHELNVEITYDGSVLCVSNTGTTFDRDGIKAVIQGNNSPKTGKYIGNKGTGFRSILNWANIIRIHSGEYHIEFSEEYARQEFEKIRNEPQIQKQLEREPKLHIPILSVPRCIPGEYYENKTTIEIVLNSDKIQDNYSVQKQIDGLDLKMLLFLPNTSSITINAMDKHITYSCKIQENIGALRKISLFKYVDKDLVNRETYWLKDTTRKLPDGMHEERENREFMLAIAVPEDISQFENGYLYSYFPLLQTAAPFPCIMHATFELSDQRNTLNSSEVNEYIAREQLRFLTEIADDLLNLGRTQLVRKLLTPVHFNVSSWEFNTGFRGFSLEEFYFDLLQKVKMYETVNGDLICAEDHPEILEGEFPSVLQGQLFHKLLKPFTCITDSLMLQKMSERLDYSLTIAPENLLQRINDLTYSWSVQDQVRVFIWWNDAYPRCQLLPNLLRTQSGEWLQYGERCYFLDGEILTTTVPEWVRTPSLQKEYQRVLLEETKQLKRYQEMYAEERKSGNPGSVSRFICQKNFYRHCDFSYTDNNKIIGIVNRSVPENDYEKACEFVKWLWDNFCEKESWELPRYEENGKSRIHYKLPTDKHTVAEDSLFYMGNEYGTPLSDLLFGEDYYTLPEMSEFQIPENQKKQFIRFVDKMKLPRYPQIQNTELRPQEIDRKFSEQIRRIVADKTGYSSGKFELKLYKLNNISKLQERLLSLPTEKIIEWVHCDLNIRDYLQHSLKPSNSGEKKEELVQYHVLSGKDHWTKGNFPNYILHIFNHTKWVQIHGEKYAPIDILMCTENSSFEDFGKLLPIIGKKWVVNISGQIGCTYEEVKEVLNLFQFCQSFRAMDSNQFYGMMLKLPALPLYQAVKLSHKIYSDLEMESETVRFQNSENKIEFFKSGMVMAVHGGQNVFHRCTDTYLPSTKIVNKKGEFILDKNPRKSNKNFSEIFGCKEYDKVSIVQPDSIVVSDINEKFQRYFEDFQKFAYAFRNRNANLRDKMTRVSITLVKEIKVTINGILQSVESQYQIIRKSETKWFITVFHSEFNIISLSECIEMIYENIASTPGFDGGKLGELFRTDSEEMRSFLIKKEFGQLDVLENQTYGEEVQKDFVNTVKRLNPEFDTDTIHIQYENFTDTDSIEKIIRVLRELGINADQFMQAGFSHALNFSNFYRRKLQDYIHSQRTAYGNWLFAKAKASREAQQNFIKELRRFECFDIPEATDPDIRISATYDIEQKVRDVFGQWTAEDEQGNLLPDATDCYKENYHAMNPDNLFADRIENNDSVQQMIYFGQKDAFEKWLKQQTNERNEEKNEYSQYQNMIPKQEEIQFSSRSNSADHTYTPNAAGHSSTYTFTEDVKRKKSLKVQGNKGELLVYNLLVKEHGEEHVDFRSEAAVALGKKCPGLTQSGEYDMSYRDSEGKLFYVEVKTGHDNKFYISPGEWKFAEQHADQYQVFYVFDLDKAEPSCYQLPCKFWNDDRFKLRPVIESYTVQF